MLFDERHGITMDWATHENLHRTRGAQLANSGFKITNYTIIGTGTSDTDAEFGLNNGTFFDEDLKIDIRNKPYADIWSQDLSPIAKVPIIYYDTAWRKRSATNFAVFINNLDIRACYNLISLVGSNYIGTLVPTSTNNRYIISWIVATNMADTPVIAILGQNQYSGLNQADAALWSELYLIGFPIVEFRPLWKVIYNVNSTYTNTEKVAIRGVVDIRRLDQTILTLYE